MSIFVDVKVLTRNHRESSPYGFCPASKWSIEKLKFTRYRDHLVKDVCCSICKDEIACDSEVREMSCSHVFHDPCIVQWLLIQNTCPLCRLKLPAD
ncbi:hypothetical protein AQUCO_01200056v1 [Aquilegia coerulea]|uniref:RING-type domain-containing protein n=1 Tax=Aquilegia coerulea TaxID=218851 RepID=A0A2G5E4F1_AQUCA|nr:hypothetical protein AQUCO_01200056v1 [Aquilegia coerulea]